MANVNRASQRIAMRVGRELRHLHMLEQRNIADKLRLASGVSSRTAMLSRKLDKALLRQWHGAADRLSAELRRVCEEAVAELLNLQRMMAKPRARVPAMRELVEDLAQLEEELGGWRFDAQESALSAITEPIELEGVELGRFEIKLRIGELASGSHSRCYEVVALELNPAAGSPQVTHPHVADERLCEGEASSAISAALGGGRLCDFFVIVRSVLTHYNCDSPYVELDNWHGEPCGECGERVDEERGGTCRRCETYVCEQCGSLCADCHELHCSGCLNNCGECEDLVCAGCIERCEGCGLRCCGQCIDDELCPTCRHQQEELQDDDEQARDEHQRQDPEPRQPESPVAPAPQNP